MRKGFSLVELMVVIAIVALLAAVSTPVYKDYVIRSRVASALNILQKISSDVNEQIARQGSLGASITTGGISILTNGTPIAFDIPPVKRINIYTNASGVPSNRVLVCAYIDGLNGMKVSSGSAYVAPTTSSNGTRAGFCMLTTISDTVINNYCGIWSSNTGSGGDGYIDPGYLPGGCVDNLVSY